MTNNVSYQNVFEVIMFSANVIERERQRARQRETERERKRGREREIKTKRQTIYF